MISASIYPALLLVIAAVVLWIILFYLLPILEPVFSASTTPGSTNPLETLLTVRQGVVIASQGIGILALAMLIAYPILRRRGTIAAALDRLPIIGTIRRSARSHLIAGTLANILFSGGDLDAALGVLTRVLSAGPTQREIEVVREKVQDGAALSEALPHAPSLDPMLQQMAALGEKTEELPRLMQISSEMLETGMRKRFEALMGLLVPTLTITVGLIVGALVLMTMNAVMSVNDFMQ